MYLFVYLFIYLIFVQKTFFKVLCLPPCVYMMTASLLMCLFVCFFSVVQPKCLPVSVSPSLAFFVCLFGFYCAPVNVSGKCLYCSCMFDFVT